MGRLTSLFSRSATEDPRPVISAEDEQLIAEARSLAAQLEDVLWVKLKPYGRQLQLAHKQLTEAADAYAASLEPPAFPIHDDLMMPHTETPGDRRRKMRELCASARKALEHVQAAQELELEPPLVANDEELEQWLRRAARGQIEDEPRLFGSPEKYAMNLRPSQLARHKDHKEDLLDAVSKLRDSSELRNDMKTKAEALLVDFEAQRDSEEFIKARGQQLQDQVMELYQAGQLDDQHTIREHAQRLGQEQHEEHLNQRKQQYCPLLTEIAYLQSQLQEAADDYRSIIAKIEDEDASSDLDDQAQ